MPTTSGVDLSISGLASGLDWKTLVSQLAQAERAPEAVWARNQSKINAKNSAFTIITSYLNQVQSAAQSLKDSSIYDQRTATSSAGTVATASATTGTKAGSYAFNITQLATAAALVGPGNVSAPLAATSNVSGVTVGSARLATPITAGIFSVNGAQVSIATTDSLQAVFNKISDATSGEVTASYDSAADKITLSSGSTVTLGSGADTSNFLQATKLFNNGGISVTSNDTLGRLNTSAKLSAAGFATGVDSGDDGQFNINGVAIHYIAATDTVQDLLKRINDSSAGVTASFDVVNNRFSLVNKTAGDLGIAVADVTGNFLSATGLSDSTLTSGTNLNYSVNGGSALISTSNTINGGFAGIAGLSVNALTTGTTTVTVGADSSGIATQVQNFVTAYNNLQSYITTNAAPTTGANGKTVGGTLTGDVDAANIASSLRTSAFSPVSITGLSTTFSQLAALGIKTNGKDNSVTLDSTALNTALTGNLGDIKKLFSDSTNGLAVKLDKFVTRLTGDSGTVVAHQTALSKQSTAVDAQIANLEKQITADTASWTKAFQAMETAQAQLTQELNYITKNFK